MDASLGFVPQIHTSMMRELLSMKELAAALGRSYRYIVAMRKDGFTMVGGRATVIASLKHLEKHPKPCRRKRIG